MLEDQQSGGTYFGGDSPDSGDFNFVYGETAYEVGANGTNNKITVTNHSNSAITARFAYTMALPTREGAGGDAANPFNDGGEGDGSGSDPSEAYGDGVSDSYDEHGANDVVGHFYGANWVALVAHAVVAGTLGNGGVENLTGGWKYDGGSEYKDSENGPEIKTLSLYAKTDSESGSVTIDDGIVLPTADSSLKGSAGTEEWATVDALDIFTALNNFHDGDGEDSTTYGHGARSANVYFAFSGRPDTGQGAYLSDFTKVGTITVTISPNEAPEYNTAEPSNPE
jgi:hypothetical protein